MSIRLASRFVLTVLSILAISISTGSLAAQGQHPPGGGNASTGTVLTAAPGHAAGGNASAAPRQSHGANNGVTQLTFAPGWGLAQSPFSTVNQPGGANTPAIPNFTGLIQPLPIVVQPLVPGISSLH